MCSSDLLGMISPFDFLGIAGIERTDHSEAHTHGQLGPGSLDRIASEEYHLQVRKMIDDSLDDLIAQSRVGWRNVTREKRSFVAEQPAVSIEIDMGSHAQVFDALQKTSITSVLRARRTMSFRSVQIVEVMEFLYRGHPEIGMRLELPI